MTIINPIFWPPTKNCVRCGEPFNAEKGAIKQGDHLFICPECAPIVIPNLIHDLSVFGTPYFPPFAGVSIYRLRLIAEAGELAKAILEKKINKKGCE